MTPYKILAVLAIATVALFSVDQCRADKVEGDIQTQVDSTAFYRQRYESAKDAVDTLSAVLVAQQRTTDSLVQVRQKERAKHANELARWRDGSTVYSGPEVPMIPVDTAEAILDAANAASDKVIAGKDAELATKDGIIAEQQAAENALLRRIAPLEKTVKLQSEALSSFRVRHGTKIGFVGGVLITVAILAAVR